MECSVFGKCGSCTLYNYSYSDQLKYKLNELNNLFGPLGIKNWDIFTSKQKNYRNRSEFRIWHQGGQMDYAMYSFEKNPVLIKSCPKADENINALMSKLKEALCKQEVLNKNLFGVEFLSATDGMLVTLIYHKRLDGEWENEAKKLEKELHITLIGRSRGIKKVLSKEYVKDILNIKNEKFTFLLHEGAFSQPNRFVNEQMISWAQNTVDKNHSKDLLELYCGHGNFTIPLSRKFNKVLATEISKKSILSAKENVKINKIENITFVRLSVEELTKALQKSETFKRLKEIDLDSFTFSHVFVDPPRVGLDEKSLSFITNFENIIYISCNPKTLARDIKILQKTHYVKTNAVFDQFAYTNHLECGVVLTSLKATKR